MRLTFKVLFLIIGFLIVTAFASSESVPFFNNAQTELQSVYKDSVKTDSIKLDSIYVDSIGILIPFKIKAHASYYADKFTGRRTASGAIFDNKKFTAAHRKLPFGTKLKITNPTNQKWVIVEVNDRGPFVKGREIDLSKAAFREIAHNLKAGMMHVDIQIIE